MVKKIPVIQQPRDMDTVVRSCIAKMIRESGKSREQIADEMTALLNRKPPEQHPVTTRMLDDYAAGSKTAARFPVAWLQVFCTVTGSDLLLRQLFDSRTNTLLDLAEYELKAFRESLQKKELLSQLIAEESRSEKG